MDIVWRSGSVPGLLGQAAALHGVYYAEHWDFDLSFEIKVARDLCDFLERFDPARDGFWSAWAGDRLAGCLAVDGLPAAGEGAQLRWFIVDPALHGQGLGQSLLGRAVGFLSERGYPRAFLWTFRGLLAARRLYDAVGFALAEERPQTVGGRDMPFQKLVLQLA
jgi:GNAT superfamily N-acetyltransferase